MMAAAHGFSNVVNAILLNTKVPYEQLLRKDKSGMTALHHATALAINNGSYIPHLIRVLKVLNTTTNQSFVDLALDTNNRTALMYAAINNNMAVGEEILIFGADPRLLDSFGVAVVDMTERGDFKELLLDETVQRTIRDHEAWISANKKRKGNNQHKKKKQKKMNNRKENGKSTISPDL